MDTPDPVTGLTERQITLVQTHWAGLAGNWKKHGVEFFMQLFQKHSNIKAFFKTFDGMAWDDIRTSAKLRAHAINFKAGISSFVDHLDDPECLVVLIQKQANNHFRRKISADEFKDAFKLFLEYAEANTDTKEEQKKELMKETMEAWVKALDTVEQVIRARMDELIAETDGE